MRKYEINDHVIHDGKEWFIIAIYGTQSSFLLESLGLQYDRQIAMHYEIELYSYKHLFNELANEV